ncbi:MULTISPECIES: Rieske (2Fe-2S) protein [unclassified Saccharicrinis]|uniref:Rieske (2Fe-2S) protein n=1 Tax=unclassified Saccharicrinis TaxID=2646859 RepID=UPI003D34C577
MKSTLFSTFIIAVLLLANSCTADTEDIIPNISFTARLNYIATDPQYNQNNPFIVTHDSYGNYIGTAGVVIFMLTQEEYYVFDLMCPYEKQISSLVEIEENGINCVCPTCGSKFAIANEYGGLLEGPSNWSLKKYNSEVRDGTLYIWN